LTIADAGDDKSTISYDADGDVGGLVAGVGQRVLMGVAKHLTRQFFTALKAHLPAPRLQTLMNALRREKQAVDDTMAKTGL
jgi:hypothetical protein